MLKYAIFVLLGTAIMSSARPATRFTYFHNIKFVQSLKNTASFNCIGENDETVKKMCPVLTDEEKKFHEQYVIPYMQYFVDKINKWDSMPTINLFNVIFLPKISLVRTSKF